jgi:hypothetical protein
MLERPIGRVDAIFSIEDSVVDIKMVVLGVEENLDWPTLMTGNEVKMRFLC